MGNNWGKQKLSIFTETFSINIEIFKCLNGKICIKRKEIFVKSMKRKLKL